MSLRSELRQQVIGRSGGICEWPRCVSPGEHMAHIRGIGRGGNPTHTRDVISNVAWLCVYHHDQLDGRQRVKLWEWESVFAAYIANEYGYRQGRSQ